MAQMRLVFKKTVPVLWPSDLIFSPVLTCAGSVACLEEEHSYKGHGSSAVCKVGISLLDKGRSVRQ